MPNHAQLNWSEQTYPQPSSLPRHGWATTPDRRSQFPVVDWFHDLPPPAPNLNWDLPPVIILAIPMPKHTPVVISPALLVSIVSVIGRCTPNPTLVSVQERTGTFPSQTEQGIITDYPLDPITRGQAVCTLSLDWYYAFPDRTTTI